MTTEQAERLLVLARQAVQVAERHRGQLRFAPGDIKTNLAALSALVKEIDHGK